MCDVTDVPPHLPQWVKWEIWFSFLSLFELITWRHFPSYLFNMETNVIPVSLFLQLLSLFIARCSAENIDNIWVTSSSPPEIKWCDEPDGISSLFLSSSGESLPLVPHLCSCDSMLARGNRQWKRLHTLKKCTRSKKNWSQNHWATLCMKAKTNFNFKIEFLYLQSVRVHTCETRG